MTLTSAHPWYFPQALLQPRDMQTQLRKEFPVLHGSILLNFLDAPVFENREPVKGIPNPVECIAGPVESVCESIL